MADVPYFALYDDLCEKLGNYGELNDLIPPQYWTEKPVTTISGVRHIVFSRTALSRMVLAEGVQAEFSQNGYYAAVSLPDNRRLFHSALAGLQSGGQTGANSALYIYDERLLSRQTLRIYVKVSCTSKAGLLLSANGTDYRYELNEESDWIYADIPVQKDCTVLKVSIQADNGTPVILTYRVG